MIFSLLKIHTQHSKKPSPLPAGAFCFLFLFFAQVQRKLRHWCRGESSAWRCTDKGGYSLSRKRVSPLNPREKGRGGLPPRPRTLAVCGSKSCAACGLHSRWQLCCLTDVAYPLRVIRCGVHGFAMSPCESLPVATAPYYREARVTAARRQTACGRGIAALAALSSFQLRRHC